MAIAPLGCAEIIEFVNNVLLNHFFNVFLLQTVTALHSLLELLSSSVAVWSMAGISLPDLRKSETAQTHEAAFLSTFGNNLAILVQQPRWLHLQRKVSNGFIDVGYLRSC